MNRRTEQCYDVVWEKILEGVLELKNNIRTIGSDFERAQINTKKNFPDAHIAGCLFHYKQVRI